MSHVKEQLQESRPSRGPNDVRFVQRLAYAKKEMTQAQWQIDGLGEVSMNQVWEWICILTADGSNIQRICGIKGAPSIRTVFHWRRKYPAFNQMLSEAEDIRAYLLAEEATDTARAATPETHQACKVAFQGLTWRASKLDPGKFADKKIEEHTFDFSDAATAELRSRVAAMAAAHPHLIGLVRQTLDHKAAHESKNVVIDVTPAQEGSPP